MDDHEAIRALFERFAAAVRAGDAEAFQALCVVDEPAEVDVFEGNSAAVREGGWTLAIRSIDQEGDVAEVSFAVMKDDALVDEAELTVTREGQSWRIRAL
jgi:ketosteroid isomerase-like protein